MKIKALKEKAGAYEFRQTGEMLHGGIVVSKKNRGIGFVGNAETNRYIFEYEDGMFSKSVKIFLNKKDNQIGTVKLGFTDLGTLEFSGKTYDWKVVGSSKVWLDSEKNVVMFLDLENNAETMPSVIVSASLEAKTNELLMLCGWYLLVVEYRGGLTNAKLAGMPVKTDDFKDEQKSTHYNKYQVTWFDVLVDAVDTITD